MIGAHSAVFSSCLPQPRPPPHAQYIQTTLEPATSCPGSLWSCCWALLGVAGCGLWAAGERAGLEPGAGRRTREKADPARPPTVAQNTKATLGWFTLEPEAAKLHVESSFRQASDARGPKTLSLGQTWGGGGKGCCWGSLASQRSSVSHSGTSRTQNGICQVQGQPGWGPQPCFSLRESPVLISNPAQGCPKVPMSQGEPDTQGITGRHQGISGRT